MSTGINILMYHQVGDFAPMKAHRSTYCHHKRFARQMAYLARFGYTVLSMDQVLACLSGAQPIPPRAVALTFDDGYENFYEYAWPVLQRHGFPAMVYLIADLLGKPSYWFASDGRDTPLLMSPERIRQLRAEGVDFGSHSASHAKLATLETPAIHEEVTRSKAILEDVLGEAVNHFCYPFGSHDRRAVDAVAAAGYTCATTCVRAPATPADDPLTLPRKAISYGDNLIGYFWRLHMKNNPKREMIRRDGYTFADATA
ncbi:polysaccharide deacetylase family protein [Nitrogeniibacter mangrovi]|uniref:Polysaccharide deacetylase family protein n=1 Tax=Nitrogeniibacter mangrovi TaxID=2016596 RepID=A0A6C1B2U1_9RHOO|nr:polysaccharide deacetylase family protein [Nitrogeniibacter mangrovi]QID16660.1 polysaccharide deacetylase family protein [Nitrogeniibacter mangrovi]